LVAGMYLAAVGSKGLRDIALDCVTKAHYLQQQLLETGLFCTIDAPSAVSFGYEFPLVYTGEKDVSLWHDELFEQGYLAGVPLSGGVNAEDGAEDSAEESDEEKLLLFAVTEKRTKTEIDDFVKAVVNLG